MKSSTPDMADSKQAAVGAGHASANINYWDYLAKEASVRSTRASTARNSEMWLSNCMNFITVGTPLPKKIT